MWSENALQQAVEKVRDRGKNVIPVQTGIQEALDSFDIEFLDTGLRRCDEQFFNTLLTPVRD